MNRPWKDGVLQISVTCRCLLSPLAHPACRDLLDQEQAVNKVLHRL